MSILELEYYDRGTDWSLKKTAFDRFNLLVGASGVGKSRILEAINWLKQFANGTDIHRATWNAEVKAGQHSYRWWTSQISDPTRRDNGNAYHHFTETVEQDSSRLVDRNPDAFLFRDKTLPRLKDYESAVSLMRDEASIAPLHGALTSITMSYGAGTVRLVQNADQFRVDYDSIEALRRDLYVPLLHRAFVLQSSFPAEQSAVVRDFREMFPTVSEVRLGRVGEFNPSTDTALRGMLTVAIKEAGVRNWVVGPNLSSGMFRAFVHLVEIELSPAGSVLLIDEVENSLGVNCLGPIIDRLKNEARDLQFILTSHHPYIINNISMDDWRVVTRRGSMVTVKRASEVPALAGRSAVDKFIRLINAPEFEDGVQ